MTTYFRDPYPRVLADLLSSTANLNTVRSSLVELMARSVPSQNKWEYLVQEYTNDPTLGSMLNDHLIEKINSGEVRYAFSHVKDHGSSYFCACENPRHLFEVLSSSPIEGRSDAYRKVQELSPPLVGLDVLIKSTRLFQEQVSKQAVEDPYGIYTMNLDSLDIPSDINFGTTLREIDTSKALYLVQERMPSFGVRVDPVADLAIHVLSIKSVMYLLESYRIGATMIILKPPDVIGNIRVINPVTMTELENEIKGHPWFGTNGPNERTIEPLLPISG